MRRIVLPLLIGLLTVLLVVAPATAARPTEWVHICVFPDPTWDEPNTNYASVSGPGMHTADARYWTEWCREDVGGRVRGVRPAFHRPSG